MVAQLQVLTARDLAGLHAGLVGSDLLDHLLIRRLARPAVIDARIHAAEGQVRLDPGHFAVLPVDAHLDRLPVLRRHGVADILFDLTAALAPPTVDVPACLQVLVVFLLS